MNERIRELAVQAGAVNVWEWASDDVLDTKNMDAEKFAELIVQECLKIAKNREDEFESAGLLEQSNAVGNVAYRISRQFGVKR
jgi:hypothetical protein